MLGVGTLLGADAKQEVVKIIPFFTTQSFASDRVKSKVNLVKPNTQESASNIVTRLLEGFSGLLRDYPFTGFRQGFGHSQGYS